MKNVQKNYNKAVDYLKLEEYEQAIQLLTEMKHSGLLAPQIKWALGLAYQLSGQPHFALHCWEQIPEGEIADLTKSIQLVKQQIPAYTTIYEQYNQAVTYAKNNQLKDANHLFQQLIANEKENPLPIECYQGYLLTCILLDNEMLALETIESLPNYVKNNVVVKDIQAKLQESTREIERPNKYKRILTTLGISAASLFIGALSMYYLNTTNEEQPNIDIAENAPELETAIEEQFVLEEQIENIKAELHTVKSELEEQKTFQTILDLAQIDQKTVINEASFAAYKQGLTAYETANYEEAITLLEQSNELNPDDYYADDAAYFLIQAMIKNNQSEELLERYDDFLKQPSRHYQSSPYYGAVMLEKAKTFIAQKDWNQAEEILLKITEEYPDEWTAARAKSILSDLTE